jgi:hypothetical protein
LLEPLTLLERRLHPKVGGTRQNAFCERQDALYVEFIELAGVTVDSCEREPLAAVPLARRKHRVSEDKGRRARVQRNVTRPYA